MLDPIVRILFVDDEELVLNALKRTIKHPQWVTHFSSDARRAIDLVGEERIDIVVTDHAMPRMSGIELLAMLRQLHEPVVRILMTGFADRDLATRAINEGQVHRFINKPWQEGEMDECLHAATAQALKRQQEELERRAAFAGRGSIRLQPAQGDSTEVIR